MRRVTTAVRRRVLRATRGDTGLTLIEMVVAMAVGTIVIIASFTLHISSLRAASGTGTRLNQINEGRVAVEAMSRSLRTAILPRQLGAECVSGSVGCLEAAFMRGESGSVRFYANINNVPDVTGVRNTNGPSRVEYSVTDGTLRESIQRPELHAPGDTSYTYCDATSPTCTVSTRVLATGVQSAPALFTYYDRSGAVLPTPLGAAMLQNVDSIDIQVRVSQPGHPSVAPTTYVTRVSLPNAASVVNNETRL